MGKKNLLLGRKRYILAITQPSVSDLLETVIENNINYMSSLFIHMQKSQGILINVNHFYHL